MGAPHGGVDIVRSADHNPLLLRPEDIHPGRGDNRRQKLKPYRCAIMLGGHVRQYT